jgi:regulator of cell morphogenesis and NO signaling
MNITPEMKMADVIHLNYSLLPVITRFNIELGFGDLSVEEVCKKHDVNLDFFIEITNSFVDDDYIPQKDLNTFPVNLIVQYLQKTHDYYLDEKIPELNEMINEISGSESMDITDNNIGLIKNFFKEYKEELEHHIEREEKSVQPYVLRIEQAFLNKDIDSELLRSIKTYSINDFAKEHDNVEEKLYDLKNIIIKYLPPFEDKALCNKILLELFRLEKDLNAHAMLEDKVLIPKVAKMEEVLLKNKDA